MNSNRIKYEIYCLDYELRVEFFELQRDADHMGSDRAAGFL
jgi:hypothetical protein